jgi:uncharacterized membrane protein
MSAAEVTEGSGLGLELAVPSRTLGAGAGWDWIPAGWRLFAKAPLMWILSLVIVFVIAIICAIIPILGQLVFQVLQGVFYAGFMVACRSLEAGGEFEIEHLFAGFKRNFGSLVVVGLLMLAGFVAIFIVFAMFVGFSIITAFMSGGVENVGPALLASGMSIALGSLVTLALMLPLMAAYWFAPVLVVMHGMAPVQAMKESFFACFRNFMPFLVYSIVMLVFGILASIPLGLGLIVYVPVMIASTYVAYRQIFTADGLPAP